MDALDKYQKLFADLAAKKAAVGWFPSSVYPVDPEGFLGKYQSGGAPVAAVGEVSGVEAEMGDHRPRSRFTSCQGRWGQEIIR